MIIDFNKIEESVIENFKGGEGATNVRMFFDGTNRIMLGTLKSGSSIGMHTHDTSSEILYILEGSGKTVTNGVTERLEKGMCTYCEKGSTHTLINDGDKELRFFAVVPQQ